MRSRLIVRWMLAGSMMFWIISILLARLNFPSFINIFPYKSPAELFTPLLWVALGLCVVSIFLLGQEKSATVVFSLILVFIILHFTLTLVQDNPLVYDSFFHSGNAEVITQTAHIDPARFGYHSWPGASIIGSAVECISGIPLNVFAYYFPGFILIVIVVGLFILVSAFLKSKPRPRSSSIIAVGATLLIFLAENNSLQIHFSPQALGFAMIVFLVYLLLNESLFGSIGYLLIYFILFGAITIIHAPSSLVATFVVLMFNLLGMILRRSTSKNNVLALVIGSLVILSSWNIYGMLQSGTISKTFIQNFVSFISEGSETATYFVVGSPTNPLLSYLSYIKHFFFFSLGACGFCYMIKKRHVFLSMILSYGVAVALFFIYVIFLTKGMLWERTLLYGALPLALCSGYLIQHTLKDTRRLLNFIVVTFLLINAYITYNNALGIIVPDSEIRTADLVVDKVQTKSITMFTNAPIFFRDPFYIDNVVRVPPEAFTLREFTNPPSGVLCAIISKQMQPSIGYEKFHSLISEMNNKMDRVYSSDFNVIYEVTGMGG